MSEDCNEVLKEVELFLDGELPSGEWLLIQQHIEVCVPCGERVEFRRRLKEIVAAKCGSEDVPPALLGRVRSLLEDHPPL